MRSQITLNGNIYKLASASLLPAGARQWSVTAVPSTAGYPGVLKNAEWVLDGPHLFSYEDERGVLSTSYGINIDTRFGDLRLGPLVTTITCTAAGGTVANTECFETSHGMNAAKFLYGARGTKWAKITMSTMALASDDTEGAMGARVTSLLYTKNAAATEEIAVGLVSGTYQVITTVGAGATDTDSAGNEALAVAIFGRGTDRIVGLSGQTVRGNILTGTVGMDASAWATVATITGDGFTPTGFALDGPFWIIGTNEGPYMLDEVTRDFFPLIEEISPGTYVCHSMCTYFPLGVIIPVGYGLRYSRYGNGESIGVEQFATNTSPVMGEYRAAAGGLRWLYTSVYNAQDDRTYIVAGRMRQAMDPHGNLISWYTIAQLGAGIECDALKVIDPGESARTNPILVGGSDSNVWWATLGRMTREPYDGNYVYAASGTWYGTEMRRNPGMIKDLVRAEFYTAGAAAARTITLGFAIDGTTTTLTGTLDHSGGATLNGAVDSNGYQNILFVDNSNARHSWASGRFIAPQLVFATNTSATSPVVQGMLKVSYYERPPTMQELSFALVLDESNPRSSAEQQQDQIFSEWGAGPVVVQEDVDGDTYTIRLVDVQVKEVQNPGGRADESKGTVRIAMCRGIIWPTIDGA